MTAIARKEFSPANFPYGAEEPIALQCLGNGKFVRIREKTGDLAADSDILDDRCLFQIIHFPNGDRKLLSMAPMSFVGATDMTLTSYPTSEEWTRFVVDYDAGLEQATLAAVASAAGPRWVYAHGPDRQLRVGQVTPDDVWCRFEVHSKSGGKIGSADIARYLP